MSGIGVGSGFGSQPYARYGGGYGVSPYSRYGGMSFTGQSMPQAFQSSNPYWRPMPVGLPQTPNFQPIAAQIQQQLAQRQAAKAPPAQPAVVPGYLLDSIAPAAS